MYGLIQMDILVCAIKGSPRVHQPDGQGDVEFSRVLERALGFHVTSHRKTVADINPEVNNHEKQVENPSILDGRNLSKILAQRSKFAYNISVAEQWAVAGSRVDP
jgi:hypothetical protein